ncbi:MAG: DNA repair protein RadC [Clostridia bacterium]|nr:DNA repair protein RadC [Clostridia bacterium]
MSETENVKCEKPAGGVHAGHRRRLRQRYLEEGLEAFEPHQVLELLLHFAIPQRDTNPIAHALLDRFGSLKGVLEASPEQLMTVQGMTETSATLVSLMIPMFRRYSLAAAEEQPRVESTVQSKALGLALLAGKRTEHFYVICLGANRRILGRQLIAEGTVTEVSAYPRLVVETAFNLNAQSVILCHNHPDGLCEPSAEDLALTHRLDTLLGELGIQLLDHVIVARDQACSMAERKELKPRRRGGK